MLDITGGKGKSGGTISLIITLTLVALIVVLVVKILKGLNTGSKIIGSGLEDVAIANQTNLPKERVTFLKQVAEEIDGGVYRVLGFKTWVSDDVVVRGCNKCISDKEAKLLSQFYKNKSGESLRNDIIENTGYFTSQSSVKFRTSFE